MTHHWQSVGHDASISADPAGEDLEMVTVEIAVGDDRSETITMWAETFARMAVAALADPGRWLLPELARRGVCERCWLSHVGECDR